MQFQIKLYHEKSLLVKFGDASLLEMHHKIKQIQNMTLLQFDGKIRNIVPAYDTIFIECFQGVTLPFIQSCLENYLNSDFPPVKYSENHVITIPVCYELGKSNDIEQIADYCNLKVETVIDMHTERNYAVYMVGFLPGFAYMGDLNQQLKMPRKANPQITEAGAVGIADNQTGIYPVKSMGGWNILGHTPLKLFNEDASPPTLLKPGDLVRFEKIDLKTYYSLLEF